MTFYAKEVTAAASSKGSLTFKVWAGVLTFVSIKFPGGCKSLAKVKIVWGGHQIAPVNESDFIAGDNETVSWQEFIELSPGWNSLTIKVNNTDTVHQHTIRVRLNVLPLAVASPGAQMVAISSSLRRLLRRVGAI